MLDKSEVLATPNEVDETIIQPRSQLKGSTWYNPDDELGNSAWF